MSANISLAFSFLASKSQHEFTLDDPIFLAINYIYDIYCQ